MAHRLSVVLPAYREGGRVAAAVGRIREVLEAAEAGWDVVVGSRSHPESTTLARPSLLRQLGSRLFNLPARAVLAGRFRDTQCGLKGFRADAARLLFSHAHIDGFAFDVELLHLAEEYGLSITEIPVSLRSSAGSSVRFGPDALRMLRDLARIRRFERAGAYDLTPDERAALARRPSHPAR